MTRRLAVALAAVLGVSAVGCAAAEPQNPAVETAAEALPAQPIHPVPPVDPLQPLDPMLSERQADTGTSFECYTFPEELRLTPCATVGTGASDVRVAIVGDSHAAMLAPSLADAAIEQGWSVQTMVSNGCVWTNSAYSEHCALRLAEQQRALVGETPFDIVIVTSVAADATSARSQQLIGDRFDQLVAAGSTVVVIQDNPHLAAEVSACMDSSSPGAVAAGHCDVAAADAYRGFDEYWLVAQGRDDIVTVPTRDLFCAEQLCPVEIGGMVVYRDTHHLTATYAHSIAPELFQRISVAVRP